MIAASAALILLAGVPQAADWPRFGGPLGTGHVSSGVAVPKTLPAAPNVRWSLKIGAGCASAVVSGGRVYYMDAREGKETAHALNASDGKEIWQAPIDDVFVDYQSQPGPRCTPVADGDRIYCQSCKGEFQCLNAADGKPLWKVNFVKDFGATFIGEKGDAIGASRHGYTGPPWVDGDRLIVGVGGRTGASVVCFDKRNGKVLWKSQNDIPGHAGPVVATIAGIKQVVSFTAEAVIGLSARDGALLWRVPVQTRLGRNVTTPVVVDDSVVVGSHTAGLIGIRVTKEAGAIKAERAWVDAGLGVNFSSPVAVGRFVYGLGPLRTLFCIDARTGEKIWAQPRFFGDAVRTDYGAFIVIPGGLLALTDSGQLLQIALDPKGPREVSRVGVCGANWCSPAYADGNIYVRDFQELRCVQLLP